MSKWEESDQTTCALHLEAVLWNPETAVLLSQKDMQVFAGRVILEERIGTGPWHLPPACQL